MTLEFSCYALHNGQWVYCGLTAIIVTLADDEPMISRMLFYLSATFMFLLILFGCSAKTTSHDPGEFRNPEKTAADPMIFYKPTSQAVAGEAVDVTSTSTASTASTREKEAELLILEDRADPWIIRDGDRYLWCFTENDLGVALYATDSPMRLGTKHLIWQAPATGPFSQQVWAPELHRFGNRWYVYFAASDGNNATHLAYVLKSRTDDPLGEYELIGPLDTRGRGGGDFVAPASVPVSAALDTRGRGSDDDGESAWAIDMTVLEHHGKLYAIWSGWKTHEDIQYLYIAPMSDPATISGPRVLMCRNDDYLWERTEEREDAKGLNEAPQVLKRGKRTFVSYSCAASWLQTYKIGLLELVGDDPLNPAHWRKHPQPMLQSANVPGGRHFGVGHGSFLLDGPEPMILYHTKRSIRPGWLRDVYIRTFRFDENDFPVFE